MSLGLPWLAALLLQSPEAPAENRPNIVLAIADDLDPDHLGFCGNPLARTPNLDRLARQGARFPVLYVQPVCRPALATLLTGRWPHETGMFSNTVRRPLDPAGALPQLLRECGYATYCAGKFWERDLRAFGFDAPEENDNGFVRSEEASQAELFRFLAERAGAGPWFLWWAPSLPHTPHQPPERFAKAFEQAPISVPDGLRGDAAEYVAAERACLAMESWLDDEFGRLVAELDELGELDETVILFLSDNGWSTASFAKGTPREKGVRSPLVVSLPGEKGAGKQLDALVDLVDLHATVLDYAGAALPAGSHGRSLRGLLEGGAYAPREALYGATFPRNGRGGAERQVYALYARDERWKYVLYVRDVSSQELSPGARMAPPFRRRAGAQELFDLHADPLETLDLAARAEHAERLSALRAGVLRWWQESGGKELELPDGLAR